MKRAVKGLLTLKVSPRAGVTGARDIPSGGCLTCSDHGWTRTA